MPGARSSSLEGVLPHARTQIHTHTHTHGAFTSQRQISWFDHCIFF